MAIRSNLDQVTYYTMINPGREQQWGGGDHGRRGAEGCGARNVDKGRPVVLDGGTLLMTYKVKQMSPVAAHCCAVMRLSIWRAAEGNVEGIF